jgi:hypothetical protein
MGVRACSGETLLYREMFLLITTIPRYITVCSLIGGLSVSCTQGLGSSIVTSIRGDNQVRGFIFDSSDSNIECLIHTV